MKSPPEETLDADDGDTPLWESSSPAPQTGVRAPRHERYRLGSEIARGGFGRIVAAEDQVLGRPVAIKELLRDSPGNRARFLREIRFTARLQHPAIVPLYDAIEGEDGLQRYAMKLVAGTTLAQAIGAARTLDERLALLPHLLAVADAVAYAHARGVIHRDIKPQNILVGSFGETLLIDWGVAKDLGDADERSEAEADQTDASMTRVGAVVGTPAYMAPEQARGELADRRSDVYALGATLYHLLAGHAPHAERDEQTGEARRGPSAFDAMGDEVPPDLASIVRKALADDPQARYASGQELRQDLQRFTTGQLVAARRYTRADLVRRWLYRHRVVAGVIALALAVVLGSGVVAAARVVQERNVAREAQAVAEARNDALTLAHAARSRDDDPTEAVSWLQLYPTDGAEPDRLFELAQDVVVRGVARVAARPPEVTCGAPLFSADGAAVFALGHPTARVQAWTGEARTPEGPAELSVGAARGPDGALAGGTDGRIFSLDGAGGARLVATVPAPVVSVATAGERALVGDRSGGITWIDLQTGATRALVAAGTRINGLVTQGETWAAVSGDGRVWTGPLDGGPARVRYQHGGAIQQIVARGDGALLLGDDRGRVSLLGSDDRARVVLTLPGPVQHLALGDGGRLLAAADGGGALRVVALDDAQVWSPPWPDSLALGLAATPADGVIAAVLADGTLRVWRPRTGVEQILRQRSKFAGPVAFSADGAALASCAVDSELRVWPTPALAGRIYQGHTDRVFHPTFLPDGRIATDSDDHTVRLWPATPGEGQVLSGHADQVYGLDLSPDGRHLASAAHDGLAIVWDLLTGDGVALRGHVGRVRRALFTADGQRVLTGGRDGTLRAWSLDGTPRQVTEAHPGGVHWLALDDDGRSAWSVGRDRRLRRWDPETGRLDTAPVQLDEEQGAVLRVFPLAGGRALSCAGRNRLVIASLEGVTRTFEATDELSCPSIALSPDRRLAAVPQGTRLSLLDLDTGVWRTLAGLPDEIHAVAWSPDGRLLAVAGLDGTARVVRLADGASGVVARSEAGILGVAFSPDSRELAVGGIDHVLRVVPFEASALLPPELGALHSRLLGLTRARFDASGR